MGWARHGVVGKVYWGVYFALIFGVLKLYFSETFIVFLCIPFRFGFAIFYISFHSLRVQKIYILKSSNIDENLDENPIFSSLQ